MIDHQLIEANTVSLKKSISDSTTISNKLQAISSPLTTEMVERVQKYVDQNDKWSKEVNPYGKTLSSNRTQIAWESDTVVEELHMICQEMTTLINNQYPVTEFKGIMIWRDHPGYWIDWHTDNTVIAVSMQIYLKGGTSNPGTEFETENGNYIAQFIPNTGYIACHAGDDKPRHRTTGVVPPGEVRYSLFALWA